MTNEEKGQIDDGKGNKRNCGEDGLPQFSFSPLFFPQGERRRGRTAGEDEEVVYKQLMENARVLYGINI